MKRRRVEYILNKKIRFYTKKGVELLSILMVGIAFVLLVLFIKFKPSYTVTISGEKVGYIDNRENLENQIRATIIDTNEKQENIDSIEYDKRPEYELNLVSRKEETNEQKVVEEIKNNAEITYKYYEIAVSNVPIDSVNTVADAEKVVNDVREEEKDQTENLDLSIVEKYTDNSEEIATNEVEVVKQNVTNKVVEKIVAEQKAKEEEERINAMPVINGIRLAYAPVSGTISSRYGVSSSIRRSTHTGLDIACGLGTPIKVTSDGTVTSAAYSGAYGNLVKVNHGNGIETWYAHTSKMYVKPNQTVKAGDIIAAVGSTGNSTGPHLHLEIRVNGQTVNPQKYLYK